MSSLRNSQTALNPLHISKIHRFKPFAEVPEGVYMLWTSCTTQILHLCVNVKECWRQTSIPDGLREVPSCSETEEGKHYPVLFVNVFKRCLSDGLTYRSSKLHSSFGELTALSRKISYFNNSVKFKY